jgi:hypothetical protein
MSRILNRRSFLLDGTIFVAVSALGLELPARFARSLAQTRGASTGDGRKPNIVFMLVDNLGYGDWECTVAASFGVLPLRGLTGSQAKARDCSISTLKRSARPPALHS